jgi:hypothetical protein
MGTYLAGTTCRAYAKRQAEAWFKSPACGPGSFLWICDRLELDAEAVRRQVLKTPSKATAGQPSAPTTFAKTRFTTTPKHGRQQGKSSGKLVLTLLRAL